MASSNGEDRYLQLASRTAQVLTRVISVLLGLFVLFLGSFGIVAVFKDRNAPQGTAASVGITFVIGLLCLILGWRLLRGHGRRQDGGLLSPVALRLAPLLFLAMSIAPVVFVTLGWSKPNLVVLLEIGSFIGMAGASWRLARVRLSRSRCEEDTS